MIVFQFHTLQVVDLCGENEITLGETVDLVRPDLDLRDPPAKTHVWMMRLFFGEITDSIDEVETLAKV